MASFREVRFNVLDAYSDGLLNDEEFVLLYDLYKSKNIDLPCKSYESFDLDTLCDDECWTEFRF